MKASHSVKKVFVGFLLQAVLLTSFTTIASAATFNLTLGEDYSVVVGTGSKKLKPGDDLQFSLKIKVPNKDWAKYVLSSTPPGSPLWYGVFSELTFSLRCKTKADTKLLQILLLYINHNTPGTRTEKLSSYQQIKANSKQRVATLEEGQTYEQALAIPSNCLNLELRADGIGASAVTGEGNNPYTGKIEQRDFVTTVVKYRVPAHEIEIANFTSEKTSSNSNISPKSGASCKTLGQKVKTNGVEYLCTSGNQGFYWMKVPLKTKAPVASTSPSKENLCSVQTARVIGSLGSTTYQGDLMSALILENLSNCTVTTSATITFICPTNGPLKDSNWIIASSTISLAPREKLAISSIEITRFFPTASIDCLRLTKVRTNTVSFSEKAPVMVRVVSAK